MLVTVVSLPSRIAVTLAVGALAVLAASLLATRVLLSTGRSSKAGLAETLARGGKANTVARAQTTWCTNTWAGSCRVAVSATVAGVALTSTSDTETFSRALLGAHGFTRRSRVSILTVTLA